MAILLSKITDVKLCTKIKADLSPSDVLTLDVSTSTDKQMNQVLDLSLLAKDRIGIYIYVDTIDYVIKTMEWGDQPLEFPILGIFFKLDDTIYVCLYNTKTDPILEPNIVPNVVHDPIEYIKTINKDYAVRRNILEYKENNVKSRIGLHSASALNETQIDFLTLILNDLIQSNQNLLTKYGDSLELLRSVGTDTVKPFDIPALVKDKKGIRDVQKEYFEYRNNLE